MKKNNINSLSLKELYLVRSFIETHKDKNTMMLEVDSIIKDKEDKTSDLNHKLTIELMEKLHFFDSELFSILKSHNIKNIQDLIDSNLNEWNLTQQRRIELEEAKIWYDFSSINNGKIKSKKNR
ncbi:MAG: hypothetical protein IJ097_02020 [Bacilli bacterium]|nr:hypothetical protein [Bacilli bacterium]